MFRICIFIFIFYFILFIFRFGAFDFISYVGRQGVLHRRHGVETEIRLGGAKGGELLNRCHG